MPSTGVPVRRWLQLLCNSHVQRAAARSGRPFAECDLEDCPVVMNTVARLLHAGALRPPDDAAAASLVIPADNRTCARCRHSTHAVAAMFCQSCGRALEVIAPEDDAQGGCNLTQDLAAVIGVDEEDRLMQAQDLHWLEQYGMGA